MDKPRKEDYEKAKEIPIRDVIMRYATLQSGGFNHNQFYCPFPGHNERTPSFHIYDDSNTYCCYGGGCPSPNGSSGIDFVMNYFNINKEEACKRIMEDFRIGNDTYKNAVVVKKVKPKEKVKTNKNKDYTNMFEKAHKAVGQTDYFKNRGFSQEIIDKYKLGYAPYFLGGNYPYIIPITKYFYISRTGIEDLHPKTINTKNQDVPILNEDLLYEDGEVFVCEGWADCLSIDQLGGKAVSINGTSHAKNIIDIQGKIKAKLIILGDNDEAGDNYREDMRKGLKIPICIDLLPNKYKDVNEMFISSPEELEKFIRKEREFAVPEVKEETKVKQKPTLNIDDLTAETIVSKEVKEYLLSFTDLTERMVENNKISIRAKKLKVSTTYNQFVNTFLQSRSSENREKLSIEMPINLETGAWRISDNGVKRETPKDIEVACTHPITITRILNNNESEDKRVEIAFYVRGQWKTVVVDASTIANHQNLLTLSNKGILVHTGNAKLLGEYLSYLQEKNQERIPYVKSIGRLGWTEHCKEFSPYNDTVFDGDAGYRELFESIRTNGDEELSKKCLQIARENDVIRLMVASSMASVLIKPMNQQIYFHHTWGGSGLGKSVGLKIQASIWGNPETMMRTMNSTGVAFEKLSAFFNSLPVALDELQALNSNEDIQAIVYKLSSGVSKSRSNKQGTIDVADHWACTFITTGEQPITNESFAEGALSRCIDIKLPSEAFNDFAHVSDLARDNYGWVGKQFIEWLLKNGFDLAYKLAREIRDKLVSYGFSKKQLNSLTMMFLGDVLFQIVVENKGHEESKVDTYNLIERVQEDLPRQKDLELGKRMYSLIVSWIARNKGKFDGTDYGEIYGVLLDGNLVCESGKEPTHAVIDVNALKGMLKKENINYRAVLDSLAANNYIVTRERGNKTINYRIKNIQTNCIKLVLGKLEQEELAKATKCIDTVQQGSLMELVPIDDDSLPF